MKAQEQRQATKVSQGYLKAMQKQRRVMARPASFKFKIAALAIADLTISEQLWA